MSTRRVGLFVSAGAQGHQRGIILRSALCRCRHNTHWTKHPSRLARDFGRKQWGDEGYAQEELVAELGAAFLCAHLELASEPREENASYIATWLEVLKNDTRFIFKAATHAQRATDFLASFSNGNEASAVIVVSDEAEARVA
jgi:antirestriction protein ArdC